MSMPIGYTTINKGITSYFSGPFDGIKGYIIGNASPYTLDVNMEPTAIRKTLYPQQIAFLQAVRGFNGGVKLIPRVDVSNPSDYTSFLVQFDMVGINEDIPELPATISLAPTIVTTQVAMTLAADNFTRANQAAWGTSTGPNSGQVWSQPVGSGGWTITGNSGRINSTTRGYQLLGTGTQGDTEGVTQTILNDFSSSPVFGVILRSDANAVNFYVGLAFPNTNFIFLYRGVNTQLASASFTFTAGHTYALRFRCTGNTIARNRIRVWDTAGSEPTTWNIDYSDSSGSALLTPGQYGIQGGDGVSGDIQFTTCTFLVGLV